MLPGIASGYVGAAQLAGLRDKVADRRLTHRAVLVLVHHAPRTGRNRPDTRRHGLLDGEELLRLLPGPRFAVLHGHIHRRFHHPATTNTPHTFGAGSSTEMGREGYWVIEVRDGAVVGGQERRPGLHN